MTTKREVGEHWVVLQQGGSSGEFYVHAHATREDAEADILSCKRSTYNATDPIQVPAELCIHLESDHKAATAFYDFLDNLVSTLVNATVEGEFSSLEPSEDDGY